MTDTKTRRSIYMSQSLAAFLENKAKKEKRSMNQVMVLELMKGMVK